MRRFRVLAVCLASAFFAGCGSSPSSTAQLRFVQASPNAPLAKVLIDGTNVASNLNFGNATAYLSVRNGSRHVQVLPVSGSTTPLLDTTVSFNASDNKTLLLTGTSGSLSSVLLTDGGSTPTTGDGNLRVLNASNGMGPADVYVVPAGSSITGVKPTATSLAFDKDTGYQAIAGGDINVVLTAPGTQNTFLNTGVLNFPSGSTMTLIVLDNLGGGFTSTFLKDQ